MRKGNHNIGGTGMAVLIGILLILGTFFTPVDFGSRAIIFIFGSIFFTLGLLMSKS